MKLFKIMVKNLYVPLLASVLLLGLNGAAHATQLIPIDINPSVTTAPDSTSMQSSDVTAQSKVVISVMHYQINAPVGTTPVCPPDGSLVATGFFPYTNTPNAGYFYNTCTEKYWKSDPYYQQLLNNNWVPCKEGPGQCSMKILKPPVIRFIAFTPKYTYYTMFANGWNFGSHPAVFFKVQLTLTSLPSRKTETSPIGSDYVTYTWAYDDGPTPPSVNDSPVKSVAWSINGPEKSVYSPDNGAWGTYGCASGFRPTTNLSVTDDVLGKTCIVRCHSWNTSDGANLVSFSPDLHCR